MQLQILADEFNLKDTAWAIMDPWNDQPKEDNLNEDERQRANIYNKFIAQKILDYFIDWNIPAKNICILLPHGMEINPIFLGKEWLILPDDQSILCSYMEQNKFNTIIYTGFHHGMCILARDTGAVKMQQYYNVFIHRELVCPFRQSYVESDYQTSSLKIQMLAGNYHYDKDMK